MSVETVRNSLTALENLARNLGLDMQDINQRRETAPQDGQGDTSHYNDTRPDSVSLTSGTLRRLHMSLSNEEPITWQQAQGALQEVRSALPEQLRQAHGGLDPQRVFALLGSDE